MASSLLQAILPGKFGANAAMSQKEADKVLEVHKNPSAALPDAVSLLYWQLSIVQNIRTPRQKLDVADLDQTADSLLCMLSTLLAE